MSPNWTCQLSSPFVRGPHVLGTHLLGYVVLVFLCAGCGYHWTTDLLQTSRPTISVPFVDGDSDGALTCAIVYALSSSGIAEVRQKEARYRLQVAIVNSSAQTIGYRRDRQKITGEIKKNLVASEARKTIVIEATLYEGSGETIVCGPMRLEADSDYDYLDGDSMQDLAFINPMGSQKTVLPFSLGQLEPLEAAEEATTKPLYTKLAKKVVEAIFNVWSTEVHRPERSDE